MAQDRKYQTLTQENFERVVLDAQQPVLVDFWADWCAPCRQIAPTIEALAEEFEDRAVIGKVHVDDHPELAQRYDIRSIPTLLFFRDGELVDRVVGLASRQVLADKLSGLVPAAA